MKDNNERANRLRRVLGDIGDDLVTEAAPEANAAGKTVKFRSLLIAACVTLFAAIVLTVTIPFIKEAPASIPDGYLLSGSAYTTGGTVELPEELSSIKVTADGVDSRLIPMSGSFIVETAGECTPETLAQYVKITPAVSMSVVQKAPNRFSVAPANGLLTPDTVYKITLGDPENPVASYAFQVERKFSIKSTVPGDLKTGVPLETGIEITFSDSLPKTTDFGKYITVSPAVKGDFILYPDGRTVAFVPTFKLDAATLYTVSVSPDISDISGRKLGTGTEIKFVTAEKESAVSAAVLIYPSGTFKEFSPSDNAYFAFRTQGKLTGDLSVHLDLYRYPSVEAAAKAIEAHETESGNGGYTYSVSGLEKVASYTEYETVDYLSYVYLGAGLDEGVYLCDASFGGKDVSKEKIQQIINVTDLRLFHAASDGKAVLWINGKGGPVKDLDVTAKIYNRSSAWGSVNAGGFETVNVKTDGSGLAVIECGEKNAAIVTAGSLIAPLNLSPTDTADRYQGYIFSDREVYFSDDTVNFFGWITPLHGAALPEAVYFSTGYSTLKTPVTLNEDGSFSGSFDVEGLVSSYLILRIVDADGKVILSKNVRITEEEKPQYSATLEFDKLFYRYGETATATLKATFFDGTPVPGLTFNFGGNFPLSEMSGVTDANGEIKVSMMLGYAKTYTTYPYTVTLGAELGGMETQTLNVYANAPYYQSDYHFRVSYTGDGPVILLNKIDLSHVTSAAELNYSPVPEGILSDPVSGQTVRYSLIKHIVTKTPYEYYDKITKRNVTSYKYSYSEQTVKSGTFTFENGKIELPTYEVSGFTGSYYYKIAFTDVHETYEKTVTAVKSNYGYYGNDEITGIITDKDSYIPGETVRAGMFDRSEEKKGLFVLYGNGIMSYACGDSFSFGFTEEMISGVSILGVYYNADAHTYMSFTAEVIYDYVRAAVLDINISTDKPSYRPGDTATVKISIPGVSRGTVLLSVVDEACFALGDQSEDPAAKYFANSEDYYYYNTFVSYMPTDSYRALPKQKPITINSRFDPILKSYSINLYAKYLVEETADIEYAAEKDAADDSSGRDAESTAYLRQYFADNPAFLIAALDKNGVAVVTFKVPDNITSWRLTALSVAGLGTGTVKTGIAVSDTVCTQEFFVNPSVCSYYIKGDDVSLSARVYGDAAGTAEYVAYLYDGTGNYIDKRTAKAAAGEFARFNFGKRDVGDYSVIINAKCGDKEDSIKSVFSVTLSGNYSTVEKEITADEIKSLAPAAYPVVLSFYDNAGSLSKFRSVGYRIKGSLYSDRSDALAAYYRLLTANEAMFGTDETELKDEITSRLGSYVSDNLLSLLSYSSGDLELTAKILAVAPDAISPNVRARIASYLDEKVNNKAVFSDETELCASLLALASLGEPVLDKLISVASVAADYNIDAKLYLCAAFAAIGEYSGANDIYSAIISEYGRSDEEYGTLCVDDSVKDVRLSRTALALITASRINKRDAERLSEYLLENDSVDNLYVIELASYLRFYMPTEKPEPKKLVYSIDGETHEITLRVGSVFSLELTRSELAAFELVSADDGIGIIARYRGTVAEASENMKKSDRVKVEKKITVFNEQAGIYKVSLTFSGKSTRNYESFRIEDCVPSGARYVGIYSYNTYGRSGYTNAWVYNSSGQRLSGYLSVSNGDWRNTDVPEYEFSVTVEYLIRGAVEGEFVVESAALFNGSTGTYNESKRLTVGIKAGKPWEIK